MGAAGASLADVVNTDGSDSLWSGQSVVITGVRGFLGRHLAGRLQRAGARIVGLSREPGYRDADAGLDGVELGDIGNPDALQAAVDASTIVFHLAAASIRGAGSLRRTDEANVVLTTHIFEAIRRAPIPPALVFTSSERVYAPHSPLPRSEQSALAPADEYARSKRRAEDRIGEACRQHQLRAAVLRLVGVYGPGDPNSSRLVPSILAAVAEGRPLRLRSDGVARRDYLYIDDAVSALLAAGRWTRQMPAGRCDTYNVGTGVATATAELARLALRLAGRSEARLEFGTERDTSAWLDCSKIGADLGWRASTSLAEGLRRTLQANDMRGRPDMPAPAP